MGLLDDAIREHLELKRKHGANPDDVARQEQEALGPGQRNEFAQPEGAAQAPPEAVAEPEAEAPAAFEDPAPVPPPEPAAEAPPQAVPAPDGEEEDVLEETPEFLQETPEHDRLWFEQKPPRDFDWDK